MRETTTERRAHIEPPQSKPQEESPRAREESTMESKPNTETTTTEESTMETTETTEETITLSKSDLQAMIAQALKEQESKSPKSKPKNNSKNTSPKSPQAPKGKAPSGYKPMSLNDGLSVGSLVWNLGGSAQNGSVPTEPKVEKIVNLTKASPDANGRPYNKVHLESTKAPKTKRTKFLSMSKLVWGKNNSPKSKSPTESKPKTNNSKNKAPKTTETKSPKSGEESKS